MKIKKHMPLDYWKTVREKCSELGIDSEIFKYSETPGKLISDLFRGERNPKYLKELIEKYKKTEEGNNE